MHLLNLLIANTSKLWLSEYILCLFSDISYLCKHSKIYNKFVVSKKSFFSHSLKTLVSKNVQWWDVSTAQFRFLLYLYFYCRDIAKC